MLGAYVINISVVEVETSQIFFSETINCKSVNDLESVIEKLAGQIAEKAEVFN
ncbi:MAG TPA: hypothetical protein VKS21_09315 [Spirochaetota bacterium]|nr:hypothetical protein [Spirochaetota bacterium]